MARSTSKIKEVRKDVWMPQRLAKLIGNYRKSLSTDSAGRLPSESAVIRDLIEAGLDAKSSGSAKQKSSKAGK